MFCRLSNALVEEGKNDKAIEVLDRCMAVMPERNVPFDYGAMRIAQSYFMAGAKEKGKAILDRMIKVAQANYDYYARFTGNDAAGVASEMQMEDYILKTCQQILTQYQNFTGKKEPNAEELERVAKAQNKTNP
ncbi:MAG: hypothetical protein HYZ42_18935 [Bacteroidetes bacterium]|nr:hypothetical protein [Bacteroidota bacterium]